jgi:predicted NAD/FAD-dependent oxidoreductase
MMLEADPYRSLPDPGETAMIEVRPATAVIGAGLSGLIAARLLAERGYPVTVFDKGRRPGGRASTRREDTRLFDHGCQYFTARDPRFLRYVEAWLEQDVVSPWNARRAACLRGVATPVSDDVIRYVGAPQMSAVAAHLANGLDIRSATRITALRRTDAGWRLTADLPLEERFEVVVLAIPAEQAAPLLIDAPHLAAAVSGVHMLPCWTALAAFDYDIDAPFDAAHFSSSPLVWAARDSSKPGRASGECWVLQAAPSWTMEHLEEHPEQIARALLDTFFTDAGIAPVTPSFLGAHRWRYASAETPLGQPCLWDKERAIAVTGDWCHSARMEGAFLSGLSAAEHIIDDRSRACGVTPIS